MNPGQIAFQNKKYKLNFTFMQRIWSCTYLCVSVDQAIRSCLTYFTRRIMRLGAWVCISVLHSNCIFGVFTVMAAWKRWLTLAKHFQCLFYSTITQEACLLLRGPLKVTHSWELYDPLPLPLSHKGGGVLEIGTTSTQPVHTLLHLATAKRAKSLPISISF